MRWQGIAARLGSRWCCAWQVGVALVVVGLVFSAGWTLRLGPERFLRATLCELLADGVGAVLLVVAALTAFRSRAVRQQPVAVVALVWIVITAVRGGVWIALQPEDLARILNSTVSVPVWALVVIYLFATYDEVRSKASELESANENLRAVQSDTEQLLDSERRLLGEAVRKGITSEIEELRRLVGHLTVPGGQDEISALADRVAAYSSGVVRETSHQLRSSNDVLLGAGLEVGRGKITRPRLLSAYMQSSQPILIPTILIVTKGFTVSALRWDPGAVASQLFAFGCMLGTIWFGRWLIDRLLRRPSASELLASTALVLVTAVVVMWGFRVTRDGGADPRLIPLPTVGLYVVALYLTARLFSATQRRWRTLSTELEVVNARLTAANEQLQAQLVSAREQLADVLHGPVQGRLAAASMALRLFAVARAEGKAPDPAETVAMTTTLLDRALTDLGQLGRPSASSWASVNEGLDHVAHMWRGLIDVSWRVTDVWQRSRQLVDGIVELSSELVTNASRHGAARSVRITVDGLDDMSVEVVAVDDGRGPGDVVRGGAGLTAVRKHRGEWALTREPDGRTRVRLVLRDVAAPSLG